MNESITRESFSFDIAAAILDKIDGKWYPVYSEFHHTLASNDNTVSVRLNSDKWIIIDLTLGYTSQLTIFLTDMPKNWMSHHIVHGTSIEETEEAVSYILNLSEEDKTYYTIRGFELNVSEIYNEYRLLLNRFGIV